MERGASVAVIRRADNEGGKDFSESANLLQAAEMVRNMIMEKVYQ